MISKTSFSMAQHEHNDSCGSIIKTEICDNECSQEDLIDNNTPEQKHTTIIKTEESLEGCGVMFAPKILSNESAKTQSSKTIQPEISMTNYGFYVKSFSHGNSMILDNHNHFELNSDTNQYKYKCNICGQSFKKTSHQKEHIRIHTGEKPYECDLCGEKFAQKNNLTGHFKIHLKDKQYKCDVCGRFYATKAILKRHAKGHSKEKPYQCYVCDKRFTRSDILKEHSTIHF